MIKKKICMLGAYAVGKTSLVRRFVEGRFSERYVTTIGVKITKKQLVFEGTALTLMLWDLHGDDAFQTVQMSYLRGSSGLLFVADGTRAETLEPVEQLRLRAEEALGAVPRLLLLNKGDREAEWELGNQAPAGWSADQLLRTSAKSGAGVEEAFGQLAARMLGGA